MLSINAVIKQPGSCAKSIIIIRNPLLAGGSASVSCSKCLSNPKCSPASPTLSVSDIGLILFAAAVYGLWRLPFSCWVDRTPGPDKRVLKGQVAIFTRNYTVTGCYHTVVVLIFFFNLVSNKRFVPIHIPCNTEFLICVS